MERSEIRGPLLVSDAVSICEAIESTWRTDPGLRCAPSGLRVALVEMARGPARYAEPLIFQQDTFSSKTLSLKISASL
jgi:hypothetical protein